MMGAHGRTGVRSPGEHACLTVLMVHTSRSTAPNGRIPGTEVSWKRKRLKKVGWSPPLGLRFKSWDTSSPLNFSQEPDLRYQEEKIFWVENLLIFFSVSVFCLALVLFSLGINCKTLKAWWIYVLSAEEKGELGILHPLLQAGFWIEKPFSWGETDQGILQGRVVWPQCGVRDQEQNYHEWVWGKESPSGDSSCGLF